MSYLDSGSPRRAEAGNSGVGAHAGYTAEREEWTPIPTLGSYAFRLQVPLTTEPQGWALRPTPYPRRLQRTRSLPVDAGMGPVTPIPSVATGQRVVRRTVSTPARGAPLRPVAMKAIRDVLQSEHDDPGQVALASDTDVGEDDSSDESFDYVDSDGDPVSEPEEGGGSSPVLERDLRRDTRLGEAREI